MYDVGEAGGVHYMVSELLEGDHLPPTHFLGLAC
jgi:hypothetical protein